VPQVAQQCKGYNIHHGGEHTENQVGDRFPAEQFFQFIHDNLLCGSRRQSRRRLPVQYSYSIADSVWFCNLFLRKAAEKYDADQDIAESVKKSDFCEKNLLQK
jgi:hypothetical protein